MSQPALRVELPAGIGDFSWTWSKLSTLGVPIDIRISADNPPRTQPLVELLPGVDKADSKGMPYHDLRRVALSKHTRKEFLLENVGSGLRLPLEANTHLDAGGRIEAWLPDVGVDHHYPINVPDGHVAAAEATFPTGRPYLAIFCASRPGILNWKAWAETQWIEFLQMFQRQVADWPVALLGAGWDTKFAGELEARARAAGVRTLVNLTDKLPLGGSLHLIRKARYFIGFPSGLSVLAHVMKCPATMFYPVSLNPMIGAWSTKEMTGSNTFHETLFCHPETLMRWLRDVYTFKRLTE